MFTRSLSPALRNSIISTILILCSVCGVFSVILGFVSIAADDWISATAKSNQQGEKGFSIGLYSFCRKNSNCAFSFQNIYNLVVSSQKYLVPIACDAVKFPGDSATEEAKLVSIRGLTISILLLVIFGGFFGVVGTFSSLMAVGFFGEKSEELQHRDVVPEIEKSNNNNTNTSAVIIPATPSKVEKKKSSSSSPRRSNMNKNNMDKTKFKKLKYPNDPNLSAFSRKNEANNNTEFSDKDDDEDEDEDDQSTDDYCVKNCAPVVPYLMLPFFLWSAVFFGLSLLLWTLLETSVLNCSGSYHFCDSVIASKSIFSFSSSSSNMLVSCGFSHSFNLVCAAAAFSIISSFFIFILRNCCSKAQQDENNKNSDNDKEEGSDDECEGNSDEAVRQMTDEQFEMREQERTFKPWLIKKPTNNNITEETEKNVDENHNKDEKQNQNSSFELITSPRVPEDKTKNRRAAQNFFLAPLHALRQECYNRHADFLCTLIISARIFEIERRQRINICDVEADFRSEFVSGAELRAMMASRKKNNDADDESAKFLPPTRIPNRNAGGFGGERNSMKQGGRFASDQAKQPMLQMPDIQRDIRKLRGEFLVYESEYQDEAEKAEEVEIQERQESNNNETPIRGQQQQLDRKKDKKSGNDQKPSAASTNRGLYDDDSTLTDTTDLSEISSQQHNASGGLQGGDAFVPSPSSSLPRERQRESSKNNADELSHNQDPNASQPVISKVDLVQLRKRPAILGFTKNNNNVNAIKSEIDNKNKNGNDDDEPKQPTRPMPRILEEYYSKNNEKKNNKNVSDLGDENHLHPVPKNFDRFGRPLPKALLHSYHQNPQNVEDEKQHDKATDDEATKVYENPNHNDEQRVDDDFGTDGDATRSKSRSASAAAVRIPPILQQPQQTQHNLVNDDNHHNVLPSAFEMTSLNSKTKALRDRLALLSHHHNENPQTHREEHEDLLNVSNITPVPTASEKAEEVSSNNNNSNNNKKSSVHSFQDYWKNRSKKITSNTATSVRQDSGKLNQVLTKEETKTPTSPTTKQILESNQPRYH